MRLGKPAMGHWLLLKRKVQMETARGGISIKRFTCELGDADETQTTSRNRAVAFRYARQSQLVEPARDWERFYGFISLAARYQVGWDHHEVAHRLSAFGFSEDIGKELGEIYWHCRCVLFVRGRHYSFCSYDYDKWLSKNGIAMA